MPRTFLGLAFALVAAPFAPAADPPTSNAVADLQARIDAGKVKLDAAGDHGRLKAVLKALDVSDTSQMLVFSKTSFQRERIAPKTPRALYFNDDVYVGFVPRGDAIELSAPDPHLGTAFYTLDQDPAEAPRFVRRTDDCLQCHSSTRTRDLPGHLVRSVFPDRTGQPIFAAGSTTVDASTPLADRWGGWYVTGTHGKVQHRGNWVVANAKDPDAEDRSANQNLTSLKDRLTVANYPTAHSDIVALLVFEHQTDLHNRLARASLITTEALRQQESLNKELKEKPDHKWDSVTRRIELAAEDVVRGLLFSGEAKLTDPVAGTSGFAEQFEKRGPADANGRSLRQFDLTTRLFKHPCSYLVYSRAFDDLPAEVKAVVWRRLGEVLSGQDTSDPFKHLSAADRTAVREILVATKKGLPEGWGR